MLCKGFLLFYIGSLMVFTTIAIILIELITISLPEWLAFVLMPVFLFGLLFMLVCGRTRNRQKRESKCFVILNIKLNQFTALEGKDIKVQ